MQASALSGEMQHRVLGSAVVWRGTVIRCACDSNESSMSGVDWAGKGLAEPDLEPDALDPLVEKRFSLRL